MEKYLGVKLIEAEPMTHGKYQEEKCGTGYNKPEFPKFNDEEEGYKVVYPDGYISWSPKVVFEEAYRLIDNMTFGLAIEAVKKGFKIARSGWNGKSMYLKFIDAKKYMVSEFELLPWIGMKTADDKFVPWLASQTDVLAEDWCIVD